MSRSTITITSDLAEAIAARLADSSREAADAPGSGALPLYADPGGVIGIRPDGTLLEWTHDSGEGEARPVEDRTRMLIALVAGARRYPDLRGLLPTRSPGAVDCRCREIPECVSGLFWCGQCGGIGWIAEGEPCTVGRIEWPRRAPTRAEVRTHWIVRALGFAARHLLPRRYSPIELVLVAVALVSFYGAFAILVDRVWGFFWNGLGLIGLGILSLRIASRGIGRRRPGRPKTARGPDFNVEDPEVAALPPTTLTGLSEQIRRARERRGRARD
jgi:hypothetical protein